MGDFKVLPVWRGAGDWHFNRYRVAFKCPPHTNKQLLGGAFVKNFPKYFESRYATVQMTDRTYATMPTFHFHGYQMVPLTNPTLGIPSTPMAEIDIAKPHTDWVVKIDDNDNLGFTAQTLKREFRDLSEDGPTKAGSFVGFVVNPLIALPWGTNDLMEVNRMHFLAGRRSWRIDDGKNFGVDGDVLVFETAAVERFSHAAFVRADSVMALQKAIPDIWVAMCNNFLRLNALVRVPQPQRRGWQIKDGVDYYVKSFANFEGLAGDFEFALQKRQGLFKTLVPAQ